MLSTCNSNCVTGITLPKTDQCAVYERDECPVRLIYAKCDFDFPTGAYDDNTFGLAVSAAFTSGDLGASFELSEAAFSDPTTATKKYRAKCKPASTIITGRELTARSYVATDVDPAGADAPYWDLDFYQNYEKNIAVAVRGHVTCSGKMYLYLDENGQFLPYTAYTFLGEDDEVDGTCVEYKNYVITFTKDPKGAKKLPYLDIVAAGVQTELAWLYQGNPATV